MERKMLFLVIPLILVGFLVSCERDPIDPPAVITEYTVSVVSDSNGVVTPTGIFKGSEGEDISLRVKPDFGYLGFVSINDEKNIPAPSDTTIKFSQDQSLVFSFQRDEAFPLLLVNQYWKEVIRQGKINGKWEDYNLTGWTLYWSPDGTTKTFDSTGKIGEHKWDYEKTSPITLHTGRSRDFPEGSISYIVRLDSVLVIENKERDIRVTLEKVGKP